MHENSTGNYLSQTRNCTDCYFCNDAEDLEHCIWINHAKTSFVYCAYGNGSELIYNSVSVGDRSYNVKFSADCWQGVQDIEYCTFTSYGATACFGCVGVKKRSYCILNRQYSKEEYFELLPRIKAHMKSTGEYGRFFPAEKSPFAYNVSNAADYFPSTRAEAEALGFTWREEDPYQREKPIPIPDGIHDCGPELLEGHLVCERTGKRFKLMKAEFEFYRRMNIPIPRVAPLERISEFGEAIRVTELGPRNCDNCGAKLETVHHREPLKVVCESCFQASRV
jgi:hypothetical protein